VPKDAIRLCVSKAKYFRSEREAMRRVLELFLISAMVLGSALGAQEENGVLVLDVYSVNVPSDMIHEKGFALWAANKVRMSMSL
jgi:hypothetical protein